MLVIEAMKNALELLEHLGYSSGSIHDDLEAAIKYVGKYRVSMMTFTAEDD